jgi:hypothetical protein
MILVDNTIELTPSMLFKLNVCYLESGFLYLGSEDLEPFVYAKLQMGEQGWILWWMLPLKLIY